MNIRLSRISIILALISALLFSGCVTGGEGETSEPGELQRWLYEEPDAEEVVVPETSTEPPRQVAITSLEPSGPVGTDATGLPAPVYFSFFLDEPARVAVEVESDAGAEIALIDRVAGVLARDGAAGRRDGRIDILLDAGEYRVESRTLRKEDPADVRVTEYAEISAGTGSLMTGEEGRLFEGSLGDYEQCSYWVSLEKDEPLILEALGRCLRDVRIWKDGVWVLDDQVRVSDYAPVPGKTMGYAELFLVPGAGNYLVTLYGGRTREWEEESGTTPLYVRRGALELGSVVDANTVIGPMGRDAFIISGDATVFEVENSDFQPVTIGVTSGLSGNRYGHSARASVLRESESTRARLQTGRSNSRRWFYVQGTPGDTVRLRALPSREYYQLERPPAGSRYLVSTISSLDSDHAIDASLVVIRAGDGKTRRDEVIRSSGLAVTAREPLYREINTDGGVSFVVDLEIPGKWAILREDDPLQLQAAFIPMRELADVDEPEFKDANPAIFDLEAGKYLVILQARRPGILKFVLYYSGEGTAGINERKARSLFDTPAPQPRRDFTFITERNEIFPGSQHVIIMNQRSGPVHALFVEQLPLSLKEPVPLTLDAGESIDLPLLPHSRGILSTGYESIGIEGTGAGDDGERQVGTELRTVTLRNMGEAPATFVLRLDPTRERQYTIPEVPDLASLFPVLEPGNRLFFDCPRGGKKQFLLRVETLGFYELMTTGRLTTTITTRTRVLTSGARAQANGPGRNALVQGFFRPGRYLVEVGVVGDSEGRAGFVMENLPMRDLGTVHEDTWYRTELSGGTGLSGTVGIREQGRFNLQSFGLYGGTGTRVEDADGWPVPDDEYAPGRYRFYSWPLDVPNRRLTGFFRRPVEQEYTEGAPRPLELNQRVRRMWMESDERTPQVYILDSPASIPAVLSIEGNMEWTITGPEGFETLEGSGGTEVQLAPGEHRISVRSREISNRVGYSLSVTTSVLADGLTRSESRLPLSVPVIVHEAGIYEFWSFGTRDIRARLYTQDGAHELAEGDDREGDWNFYFSRFLPPGQYLLAVEDTFSGSGLVTLFCGLREEVRTEMQQLPLAVDLRLSRDIVGIPFTSGPEEAVFIARCDGAAELSLYRGNRLLAEGEELPAVPLKADTEYLLRLRNTLMEPVHISLSAEQPDFRRQSWDGVSRLGLQPGVSKIDNESSTSILADPDGLEVSGKVETPAMYPENGVLPAQSGTVWCRNRPDPGAENGIQPLILKAGDATAFIIDDDGIAAGLASEENSVCILEVRTMAGFLGMEIQTPPGERRGLDWTSADVLQSSTILCMKGGGVRRVRVWDGEPLKGGRKVQAYVTSYPVGRTLSLEEASFISLTPGEAVRVATGTADSAAVLLAPGLVVCTDDGNTSARTFAARSGNRSVRIDPADGGLYLVNTGTREGIARFEAAGRSEPLTLTGSSVLEARVTEKEDLSVILNPAGGKGWTETALWAANLEEAVLLTSGGRRIEARGPENGRGWYSLPAVPGVVRLQAGPGPVVLWLGEPDNPNGPPAWVIQDSGNRVKDLEPGESALTTGVQRYRFTVEREEFLALSTGSRGITVLRSAGGDMPSLAAFGAWETRDIFALLEKGTYEVITRGFAGEEQPYPLVFDLLTPEVISEDSENRSVFLDVREKAVFRVDVKEEVPVGLGLEAESDLFSTVLLNGSMEVLGRGRYFYRTLEEGTYFLLVENGDTPMLVRPVAAGDTGSRRGVPESVIDSYRGE